MGKVMRHTLGASLNIRHNLSSSKGPKPLQLKLLTTYIPKTSAFTLRSEERFSRNAETDLVCRLLLEKKKRTTSPDCAPATRARGSDVPVHVPVRSGRSGSIWVDRPHVRA